MTRIESFEFTVGSKSLKCRRSWNRIAALLAVIMCGYVAHAKAAPLSIAVNGPTNTYSADPADPGNSAGSSIALTAGIAEFGSDAAKLIDGSVYGGQDPLGTPESLTPADGTQVVITLPASALGWNISSFVSLSGSGAGQLRSQQVYQVEASLVGDGAFSSLLSVGSGLADNVSAEATEVRVTTSDDTLPFLATGVDELRITFFNSTSPHVQTMYREFDIYGSAVPEPLSLALAGSGIATLSLVVRLRRRTNR